MTPGRAVAEKLKLLQHHLWLSVMMKLTGFLINGQHRC